MWVSIATCFFIMTKFKVEISAEWHAQTFFVFVHVTCNLGKASITCVALCLVL